MRVILSFIFLISSVLISQILIKKYTLRTSFYSCYYSFNNNMINQINFENRTLQSIIDNNEGEDFYSKLKENIYSPLSKLAIEYLTDDEVKAFKEYCDMLGRSDRETQNNQLLFYEKTIKEKLDLVRYEEKSKRTLYTKMGLMIGLVLFVIVI